MCGSGGGIFGVVENMSNAVMADATGKGNAKTINSVAQLQAKNIKKQGERNSSSARAAAAENGLDIDVGSAALIQDEHISDAEYDAAMTESNAGYQAKVVRMQAKQQRNNYGMKAASGALEMGAQMMGMGWK